MACLLFSLESQILLVFPLTFGDNPDGAFHKALLPGYANTGDVNAMKTNTSSNLPRALTSLVMIAVVLAFASNASAGSIPSLAGPSLMVHLKADSAIGLNGSNVSQ